MRTYSVSGLTHSPQRNSRAADGGGGGVAVVPCPGNSIGVGQKRLVFNVTNAAAAAAALHSWPLLVASSQPGRQTDRQPDSQLFPSSSYYAVSCVAPVREPCGAATPRRSEGGGTRGRERD